MLSDEDRLRIIATIHGTCLLSKQKLARALLSQRPKAKKRRYVYSDGKQWWFEWMHDRRGFHNKLTPAWLNLVWEPVDPIHPLELLAKAGDD